MRKKIKVISRFQSTFPRGERHESSDTGPLPFKFQSTFPRGERHGRGSGCTLRSYFNPRSLVGNDKVLASSSGFSPNFNPRSLVGNDRTLIDTYCALYCISIHVPSWGTTNSAIKILLSYHISIHVPSWGTTLRLCRHSRQHHDFNPRSLVGNDSGIFVLSKSHFTFQSTFPRGERREMSVLSMIQDIISIHVPSWGTTIFWGYTLPVLK